MALIECPECGQEISDRAPHCIFCGYPISQVTETQTPKSTTRMDNVNFDSRKFVPVNERPQTNSAKKHATSKEKKSIRGLLCIVGLVLVVAIILYASGGKLGGNHSYTASTNKQTTTARASDQKSTTTSTTKKSSSSSTGTSSKTSSYTSSNSSSYSSSSSSSKGREFSKQGSCEVCHKKGTVYMWGSHYVCGQCWENIYNTPVD